MSFDPKAIAMLVALSGGILLMALVSALSTRKGKRYVERWKARLKRRRRQHPDTSRYDYLRGDKYLQRRDKSTGLVEILVDEHWVSEDVRRSTKRKADDAPPAGSPPAPAP